MPSLRDSLTRKQRETRRGCAELRLAERSAAWNAKPQNRRLRAWWEYLNIRLFTERAKWTEPQRKMMRKAAQSHGIRWGTAMIVLLMLVISVYQGVSSVRHRNQMQSTEVAVDAMRNSTGRVVQFAKRDLKELPANLVVEELLRQFQSDTETQKLTLRYDTRRWRFARC